MAATYRTFISARTTVPDMAILEESLRSAIDATVGVSTILTTPGTYTLKRSGVVIWTPSDISTAQNLIDTSPVRTVVTVGKKNADHLPIELKALGFVLLDQINVLRQRAGLATISVSQVLPAIKVKIDDIGIE